MIDAEQLRLRLMMREAEATSLRGLAITLGIELAKLSPKGAAGALEHVETIIGMAATPHDIETHDSEGTEHVEIDIVEERNDAFMRVQAAREDQLLRRHLESVAEDLGAAIRAGLPMG